MFALKDAGFIGRSIAMLRCAKDLLRRGDAYCRCQKLSGGHLREGKPTKRYAQNAARRPHHRDATNSCAPQREDIPISRLFCRLARYPTHRAPATPRPRYRQGPLCRRVTARTPRTSHANERDLSHLVARQRSLDRLGANPASREARGDRDVASDWQPKSEDPENLSGNFYWLSDLAADPRNALGLSDARPLHS